MSRGNASLQVYGSDGVTFELRDGNVGVLAADPEDCGDGPSLAELHSILREVTRATPSVVVLTGAGDSFVPRESSDGSGEDVLLGPESRRLCGVVSSLDCPVIAALRREVLDGGFALSLRADVRIGSRSAEYGLPGLTCESSGIEYAREHLEVTAGRGRTRELLSTARSYDAETMLDWGVLNEVVPADAVVDRALNLAEKFAHRSTIAYRYVKRAVDAAAVASERRVESDSMPGGRVPPTGESTEPRLDSEGVSTYDTLELDEPRDGIYRITLDRQRRLNALTGRMVEQLRRATDRVAAREPDAIVVAGSGRRAFSVGLDPRADVVRSGEPADAEWIARAAQRATATLASVDAPTVAEISGYALGGGLEIALAADARVGGESSTYGLPEITRGLVPAAGGTQRLPGIVGWGRAKEMVFTGDHYDAETMADWGLVTRVVSDEQVTEAALDVAERLAEEGGPDRSQVVETTPTVEGCAMERAGNRHGFTLGPFDDESVRAGN